MQATQATGGVVYVELQPPPGMPGAPPGLDWPSTGPTEPIGLPLETLERQDAQQASDEEMADFGRDESPLSSEDEMAAEPSHADDMIYGVANELLGKVTFNNPDAETMLRDALRNQALWTPDMHSRVYELFSGIFFYYPNGSNDRSVWRARDTGQYIRNWRTYASMRTRVTGDPAAATNGRQLSESQTTQLFKGLQDGMDWRHDQQNKGGTYYNSCTESKMRTDTGHKFVANAIWEIGLPRLPAFATEQQSAKLSPEDMAAVPEAIQSVLLWLSSHIMGSVHAGNLGRGNLYL